FLPESSRSWGGGMRLGNAMTGVAHVHEARLGVEDLRQHVAIRGMTGAGKSTTAAALVGQIAKLGLPVMVMDWHNEYGTILSRIGGRVLSPTRDDFTLNPLEGSGLVDRTEHIEMVTDIFADIYRFTHPQSFMFRNALQKCLGEASEQEIPTLSSLVRTIEAYPLRSAYDNETRVGLPTRMVPPTPGHGGQATDGPGTWRLA